MLQTHYSLELWNKLQSFSVYFVLAKFRLQYFKTNFVVIEQSMFLYSSSKSVSVETKYFDISDWGLLIS